MIYAGISINGRTDLHIIRNGALTGRRYRGEIFRPIIVPYTAWIRDEFILIDDISRPHRSNLVNDFLLQEAIIRMEWPACSPDMNPIEHVRDIIERQIAGRLPLPQTLQGLERSLLEEWGRIFQPPIIASLISCLKGVHCCCPWKSYTH